MPRILVVDDEPDVADLVAAILRPAGCEVETVHGGRAALEQIEGGRYDLVICDLVMPDVDGLAVFRAIQKRGSRAPSCSSCPATTMQGATRPSSEEPAYPSHRSPSTWMSCAGR